MRRSIILLGLLLAFGPAAPDRAAAEVTALTAAALQSLPDGTRRSVIVAERGGDATHAYHVTRRGPRLTIFDRGTRQYRTFHVARSGTVVTIVDRAAATRASFVVHGGGVTPRVDGRYAGRPRRLIVRPSGVWRDRAVRAASDRIRPSRDRAIAFDRALRDLDATIDRLERSPTLTDAAAVAFVLDP